MQNITWKQISNNLTPLCQELSNRGGSITDSNSDKTEDLSKALDNFSPIEKVWHTAWKEWRNTGKLLSLPPAANRLGYIHIYSLIQTAKELDKIYPDGPPSNMNIIAAFNWLRALLET